MKRILMAGFLAAGLSLGAQAQETESAWLNSHSAAKVADLTVGDLTAFAQARSVTLQQQHYVFRAGLSSFLVPGLGQFETGDVAGGTLHLAGQIALIGATVYGAWTLMPADLKVSGLSASARHSLVENYWMSDPGKIAPAAAVMAGGFTLSLIHSFWASRDARAEAKANIADGKVTFEPTDFGLGMGMRMRF